MDLSSAVACSLRCELCSPPFRSSRFSSPLRIAFFGGGVSAAHWFQPLFAACVSIAVAAASKSKLIRRATTAGAIAATAVAIILLTEFSLQYSDYLNWRRREDLPIFGGISLFHATLGAAVGVFVGAVVRVART